MVATFPLVRLLACCSFHTVKYHICYYVSSFFLSRFVFMDLADESSVMTFLFFTSDSSILMKQEMKNPFVPSSPGRHLKSEQASSDRKVSTFFRGTNRFLPDDSISLAYPRRGQEDSTSFWGARRKPPALHSSDLSTCRMTPSFSIACMLHVEYTTFLTLGTNS